MRIARDDSIVLFKLEKEKYTVEYEILKKSLLNTRKSY